MDAGTAADVRMRREKFDDRTHFRLRRRKGPGAELFEFLAPVGREVAIQVEALRVAGDTGHRDVDAVEVFDAPFGEHAKVFTARSVGRRTSHQKARLLWMLLPRAVRIGDPHLQDPAVTVEVFRDQPVERIFVERIAPRRRAHVARVIAHRPFGAVGVDARANVERARIECARDVCVVAALFHQPVDEIQTRAGRRKLDRMNVAVDPVGGLVLRRAGCALGQRHDWNGSAFVAGADRFQRNVVRILVGKAAQEIHQFVVAIKARVVDGGHGAGEGCGAGDDTGP